MTKINAYKLSWHHLILLPLIITLIFTTMTTQAAESNQSWQQTAGSICHELDQATEHFRNGQNQQAHKLALMAYFQHYDTSMEPASRQTMGTGHVFEIEQQFNAFANALLLEEGQTIATARQVQQANSVASKLCTQLKQDATTLAGDSQIHIKQPTSHFVATFSQSFVILLREGFEAMLIITALLAYLKRSEQSRHNKVIYIGATFAVISSFATAFVLITLIKTMNSQHEVIEGITMLVAAVVMFFVSYWLIAKRQAMQWAGFINKKMSSALSRGNLFALGLTAFLAVYREGAETILFYQALLLSQPEQLTAIISGLITATVLLCIIYYLMRAFTVRLPIKLFFTATACFLYYMSIYFVGNGIIELQQAGWINITPLHWLPELSWLGLSPTLQSAGVQAIFVSISLLAILIWHKTRKQAPLTQG